MNDDEVEELIAKLERLLIDFGFTWVLEEATTGRMDAGPTGRRDLAASLLTAIEAVTVQLSAAELAAAQTLGVGEMTFKYPEESEPEAPSRRQLTGAERQQAAAQNQEHAFAFAGLRQALNAG